MTNAKVKSQEKKFKAHEPQKWFVKEDLHDLAKIGSDFLKKTVNSGIDVFKDVKENLPKEASHLLNKGKEELLRGLTNKTAKSLVNFTIEKFFKLVCEHRFEFSIRIRRNKNLSNNKADKAFSSNNSEKKDEV